MIVYILCFILWSILTFLTARYDFVNCYKNEKNTNHCGTWFCLKDYGFTPNFYDCPFILIWFFHFIALYAFLPCVGFFRFVSIINEYLEESIKDAEKN